MTTKPNIIFVLGAPGSGKGTVCARIVDTYGYVHLSAGDLLREERNRKGSEFGELIENYITNGQIVPVEITCSLLENAMNTNIKESNKNNFLIDGFPRNKDNLDGWNKAMAEKVNLQFVLVLTCEESVCVERCLRRGLSSNRTDDNEESLKKRFQTFINDSLPIINHYKEQDLVKEVDGQRPADEVFGDVQKLFN